jgi:hypothetical protein
VKKFSREEHSKLFNKLWKNLKREWFKVESLQDYSGEDDSQSLREWLAGNREVSRELLKKESRSWLEEVKSSPAKIVRIHVVDYPLSQYLEWEIEAYKIGNIPAGEEVMLVDRKLINFPVPDFMIWDEKEVTVNHYDDLGALKEVDYYKEGEDISYFSELKKLLLQKAVSV